MPAARELFGTDGIRGVANHEPVTPETALRLGQALARRCRSASARPRIVVGRDPRLSGDMLEAGLIAGITSMGADVLLAGVLPTPAIAYLTRHLGADAGVVVSASHNTFADNGIKLFAATGFKLGDDDEAAIEQLVRSTDITRARPTANAVGTVVRCDDAHENYLQHLAAVVPQGLRFNGVRIVVDAANGAAHAVGPMIFRALGADVIPLGVAPNGTNINAACGAMHPQQLQATVHSAQAQLGIALDGDADRVILADEHGEIVDGDELLALFACDMLQRGTLRNATVVATLMSNFGLEIALRARGVALIRTAVGDRYVVEEMRRRGYNLGGEQSGHLILLDHSTTGDGLVAALMVASLMTRQDQPLSALKRVITKLPQTLVNVRVARRDDLDSIAGIRDAVTSVRAALNDRGRVLVRYSGTEPLVRVMVEGEDGLQVEAYAQRIAAAIRQHVGE